jgi:hypothetical protein
LATEIREALAIFYANLKSAEKWLGFIFITGVTKFGKTSIFSKLINLTDLTLNEDYSNICGLTMEEFNSFFEDQMDEPGPGGLPIEPYGLKAFIAKRALPPETTKEELRRKILSRYDGYSWDGQTRLLNPWSVFSAFREKKFKNFWFALGTPTFLKDHVAKDWQVYEIYRTNNFLTDNINAIDIDDMKPTALLFQTGYLTIEKIDESSEESKYYLRFPNSEVEASMYHLTLGMEEAMKNLPILRTQAEAMLASLSGIDAEGFKEAFESILASIPFNLHLAYESYYESIFLMSLGSVGQRYESASPSGNGFFDIYLQTTDGTDFVIEMKYVSGKNVETNEMLSETDFAKKIEKATRDALDQIEKKKYDVKFKGKGNKIYKTALVVGHYSDVLVVFQEAKNWQLVMAKNSLYEVKRP